MALFLFQDKCADGDPRPKKSKQKTPDRPVCVEAILTLARLSLSLSPVLWGLLKRRRCPLLSLLEILTGDPFFKKLSANQSTKKYMLLEFPRCERQGRGRKMKSGAE